MASLLTSLFVYGVVYHQLGKPVVATPETAAFVGASILSTVLFSGNITGSIAAAGILALPDKLHLKWKAAACVSLLLANMEHLLTASWIEKGPSLIAMSMLLLLLQPQHIKKEWGEWLLAMSTLFLLQDPMQPFEATLVELLWLAIAVARFRKQISYVRLAASAGIVLVSSVVRYFL